MKKWTKLMQRKGLLVLAASVYCGVAAAGNIEEPKQENKLELSPPPALEGLHDKLVTVNVQEIGIGEAGLAFERYLSAGSEEVSIKVLEISSNTPYWLDYMSSMGANSSSILKTWIEEVLLKNYQKEVEDQKNKQTRELMEEPSLLSSYFNGAPRTTLKEGIGALSDFIGGLLGANAETSSIDRPFYRTSFKICPFSYKLFSFILVDPEPQSGPDTKTYLIIIESLFEE